VGESRVLPEALEETYRKIKDVIGSIERMG
jgi:hypothetical protein